jgi:hypothetical protein
MIGDFFGFAKIELFKKQGELTVSVQEPSDQLRDSPANFRKFSERANRTRHYKNSLPDAV